MSAPTPGQPRSPGRRRRRWRPLIGQQPTCCSASPSCCVAMSRRMRKSPMVSRCSASAHLLLRSGLSNCPCRRLLHRHVHRPVRRQQAGTRGRVRRRRWTMPRLLRRGPQIVFRFGSHATPWIGFGQHGRQPWRANRQAWRTPARSSASAMSSTVAAQQTEGNGRDPCRLHSRMQTSGVSARTAEPVGAAAGPARKPNRRLPLGIKI